MTQPEFNTQIERLITTYGKLAYPGERVLIFWNEFGRLPESTFRRMADFFIGEFRQAPLLKDFREIASKMREKILEKDKEQLRKDVSDFWGGRYAPEEKKWIVLTIRERIQGRVSDTEYAQFLGVLSTAANGGPTPKPTSYVDATSRESAE